MSNSCAIRQIVKRDGTIVGYDRARITAAITKALVSMGRPDARLAASMAAKVEGALVDTYGSDRMPSVEDIQDIVETVLMENRLTDVARDYIIYRHRRAMARAARADAFEVTDNVPYKKIYEVLRWNIDHGCDSVPALNRIIAGGGFPALVADVDRRYDEETRQAAVSILQKPEDIRVVIVAGPSSSGKTTTTIKVSEKLSRAGIALKALNIDHYFFNLEQHPRDEFGDYDYETPNALDLPLINRHLLQLLNGKTIKTPHYDFKTGQRTPEVHEFALGKKEVLLIDSLHGLYDGMTQSIPASAKYKLYIETLGQFKAKDGSLLRWADNRLLRRMSRDKDFRNLQPIETLTHWHYVRRSELEHIIPYIKNADFVVNSALPYELPLLRRRLFRYLSRAVDRFANDPRRLDAHIRANRVHAVLKPLRMVKDESCVPSGSLLREFIGGSRYKY